MLGNRIQLSSGIGRITDVLDPLDRLRRAVPEVAPVPGVVESLSYYDLVLAVIPTAFIFAVLLGNVLGVSLRTMLIGASFVGVVTLVDALFVNPPRDST